MRGIDGKMEDKPIAERVQQLVLTMPDDEFAALSVSKLAQDLDIDRFKLSRQFKCQTEMTLEDFLFKEKMTRAAFLMMAYSDLTIKDVAERIGFCTSDYFIRKFRQYFGLVPGKYKEFKMPRSGIGDRRNGIRDRRQKVKKSKIPGAGDRRTGTTDRRKGQADRRKQNNQNHDMEQDSNMTVVSEQNIKNTNSCESCYFKKLALDFDDLK